MCTFQAPSIALHLNYLRLVHGNDSQFRVQCGISGSSYMASSISAFYSHIYRKHSNSGVIQMRVRSQSDQHSSSSSVAIDLQPQSDHYTLQGECIDSGKWLQLLCCILYCRFISADVQADLDLLLGTDSLIQQRSASLFLLKLKELRKITQVTIDDIISMMAFSLTLCCAYMLVFEQSWLLQELMKTLLKV